MAVCRGGSPLARLPHNCSSACLAFKGSLCYAASALDVPNPRLPPSLRSCAPPVPPLEASLAPCYPGIGPPPLPWPTRMKACRLLPSPSSPSSPPLLLSPLPSPCPSSSHPSPFAPPPFTPLPTVFWKLQPCSPCFTACPIKSLLWMSCSNAVHPLCSPCSRPLPFPLGHWFPSSAGPGLWLHTGTGGAAQKRRVRWRHGFPQAT